MNSMMPIDPTRCLPSPLPYNYFDGAPMYCMACGIFLSDKIYCCDPEGAFCEACLIEIIKQEIPAAEQYALEHCEITQPIRGDDPAHSRHQCTNYRELIRELDRHHPIAKLYYAAIRRRIDEMVFDASYDGNAE